MGIKPTEISTNIKQANFVTIRI